MQPPKFKLTAFLVALLILGSRSFAQKKIVSDLNTAKGHTYQNIEAYTAFLNKTAKDNSVALDKKYQKDYLKFIGDKNTDLIKDLTDHRFLFDDSVHPYLSAIFYSIVEKNGLDKTKFHFFVNRTSAVNAYSYEDGTVVCNLGLLNIMENESQLAMVFCHELAHYMLKHVNRSIMAQLELYNSQEFLEHIKKVKRQEYNAKKELEDALESNVFNRSRHSRSQERSADSLGIELFKNTGYNSIEVAHVFDLLAAAENNSASGILSDFFKKEAIDIDESWLKPAKRMNFGAVKKEVTDSLKTHPDCAVRKAVMQAHFAKFPKPGADFLIGNMQKLTEDKKIALFNAASYSKENDNLSYYFYQLIQDDVLFPQNAQIKSEIFDTMVSFYKHQKTHTLHTIVSSQYIPDDDKDEYAVLLRLFENADLDTMAGIAAKYYNNNKNQITASAETINNLKPIKN